LFKLSQNIPFQEFQLAISARIDPILVVFGPGFLPRLIANGPPDAGQDFTPPPSVALTLTKLRLKSMPRRGTDLHIEVPAVEYRDVSSERAAEHSPWIRERVARARQHRHQRFTQDTKAIAMRG
jgi:hypothetical protein